MELPKGGPAFTQILTSFIETQCSSLLTWGSSSATVLSGSVVLNCIQEVPGSNFCWNIDYLDWGFLWFSSEPPVAWVVPVFKPWQDEWSASRPRRIFLTSGESDPVTRFCRMLNGPQNRSGRREEETNLAPSGTRNLSLGRPARRHTDFAILALTLTELLNWSHIK
jgi:hypothetical protein